MCWVCYQAACSRLVPAPCSFTIYAIWSVVPYVHSSPSHFFICLLRRHVISKPCHGKTYGVCYIGNDGKKQFYSTLVGWLFRIFIFGTLVLPFIAPLLLETFANRVTIEESMSALRWSCAILQVELLFLAIHISWRKGPGKVTIIRMYAHLTCILSDYFAHTKRMWWLKLLLK